MDEKERKGLLYKVASLYYEKKMKKYQIAAEVNLSSTQIAILLREAQREEIVRITVDLPRLTLLQDELKSRYGLIDAIVIPYDRNCAELLKRLGKAAAEYFESKLQPETKVALGGGYILYEMITALPHRKRNIDIYPAAIIGRGPTITHIDPMILVTLLWAKSGRASGSAHYVTVPPPDQKSPTRREVQKQYAEFSKRRKIGELMESLRDVDTVFASIGALDVDQEYKAATQYGTRNLLDEMRITDEELRSEGAVGDIIYSFFDKDGNTKPQWQFFLTMGVDQLRQMVAEKNRRVVVIVGSYKMEALKAVLRGKLCNVLITDAIAAESLLT